MSVQLSRQLVHLQRNLYRVRSMHELRQLLITIFSRVHVSLQLFSSVSQTETVRVSQTDSQRSQHTNDSHNAAEAETTLQLSYCHSDVSFYRRFGFYWMNADGNVNGQTLLGQPPVRQ